MFSYFKNDLNNIFKNLLFLQMHKMIFIIIYYILYILLFLQKQLVNILVKYK